MSQFSEIFDRFPPETRVWVYQSDRPLDEDEAARARDLALQFVQDWTSHDRRLRAHAETAYGRFVLLMVDETQAGASGCSIDKSVKFVQQLGQLLGVDFFDRMLFAWKENGTVRTAHKDAFAALYREKQLADDTIVFNNLVQSKSELLESWELPLGASWHKRFV